MVSRVLPEVSKPRASGDDPYQAGMSMAAVE